MTKYKDMIKEKVGHLVRHALINDELSLTERKQKKTDDIAFYGKVNNGGDVDLDDGRGNTTLKGFKHLKFSDTDPSTGELFTDRFKDNPTFKKWLKTQQDAIQKKIVREQAKEDNYTDILEVKVHIANKKIIPCHNEAEMNSKAGPNDRKIKVKIGKQKEHIIVKNGI